MIRSKLIIADPDGAYVSSIMDYISGFYPYRFEILSFTKLEELVKFLSQGGQDHDLLLVSPDFNIPILEDLNKGPLVILAPGRAVSQDPGIIAINKYQHGEGFVADIISVLSQTQKDKYIGPKGYKNTKTICTYSPLGGIGKTSIAISSSILCSRQGLKVFYLNLESINSSEDIFQNDPDKSFSKIIFHLKEKSKSLPLKIEGIRCSCLNTGLHYFSPAHSPYDVEELQPEEVLTLVNTIKSMGQYDYVFIDMNADFNRKTSLLIRECDHTLLIYNRMGKEGTKLSYAYRQMEKMFPSKEDFLYKVKPVENKFCRHNETLYGDEDFWECSLKVPLVEAGQDKSDPDNPYFFEDPKFISGINNIINKIQ